jgi:Protein of unknown function (DUF993)
LTALAIPEAGGSWRTVELSEPRSWPEHPGPYRSRVAFAAAHVVADPFGENVPGAPAVIDWDLDHPRIVIDADGSHHV